MFIYLGYTYESKSPTMARSYFKQAAQVDPDFYKGHYESGRIFFLEKKYSKAQAPLKQALNLNPESADVYGMLGQMFYGMDQYEEAAESLEKALAMSTQTHWIPLKLGDTYFYGLKKGKREAVIINKRFQKVVQIPRHITDWLFTIDTKMNTKKQTSIYKKP